MLRQAIFTDLAPQSTIEWLLVIDVAELSHESNTKSAKGTILTSPPQASACPYRLGRRLRVDARLRQSDRYVAR